MSDDKLLRTLIEQVSEELGESKYLTWIPNEYQQAAFDDGSLEKFIFGGNRSGKTSLGCYILTKLAEGKYRIGDRKPKSKYYVWISSLDNNLTKQVIIRTLKQMCPAKWLKVNENRNFASITTDKATVEVDFKSVDAGVDKYQGASVDLILLDEEHPEEFYTECKMRTLDCGGQLITTMTPLKGKTWTCDYSLSKFHITLPTDANPSLRKDDIDRIFEGMTEKEIRSRRFGEFVDMSGAKFLDPPEIRYVQDQIIKGTRYSIEPEGFVPNDNGPLEIFGEDIKDGERYIMSLDPATGSGQDPTCIGIYKASINGLERRAFYRSNSTNIPEITRIVLQLAFIFNQALINMDVTGLGISIMQELVFTHKYPNLCGRENPDAQDMTSKLGFRFTDQGRNYLLHELRKSIQKRIVKGFTKQHYLEFAYYRYDDSGKRYDHIRGQHDYCHDDSIMETGLAVVALNQNPMWLSLREEELKEKTFTWNDLMVLEQSVFGQEESADDGRDQDGEWYE